MSLFFIIFNVIDDYEKYQEEVTHEINKYILIEKQILKEKVNLFAEEFEYILNNIKTPEKLKINNFKKIVENYNKNHIDRYIFIDSENGGVLVHPDKKFVGVDFLKSKNEKFRKEKEKVINTAHSKNHFVTYEWINPKTNKKELKISYVVKIKGFPYFIGSVVSLNKIKNIEKEMKDRYLNNFIENIVTVLLSAFILFFIISLILNKVTNKLINDLKIFEKFAKEEKIEKNRLYFDEFKELAIKILEILNQKTDLLKNLEKKTYYDLLTGLPNKFKLKEDLEKLEPKGSMIVDIKNFSLIDDYYSIEIGDLLLKEFGKSLSFILPKSCNLYRYSADEFIVLNCGEISCSVLIEKIINYFKEKIFNIKYKDKVIPINVDVVIAILKDGSKEKVMSKLRLALLYAKKNDLNFVEYNDKMDIEKDIIKKFESIDRVKKALEEDKIIPVFQKIVKPIKDSYECLVRIKESNKLISPYFFLDDVRNTSLYFDITKTMIRKSCEVFKNRKEDFSINFSYKDLHNEEIKKYLVEYIEKYNLQNRVIIELLETEAMEDFKEVIKFIKEMRPYGIKIAIDDFGTGYSNFSYLADIKPDYLKIDGSLIKTIDKNERYYTIVKHVNAFAHDLGVQTIAEFVHNEEVYNVLREIGIDAFQGYYLAEPKEKI
jgi:diguanylate cyclase (GGDEF)-like protein